MKTNLLEFDVKGVNDEKINLAGLYDCVFIAKKWVQEKDINLSMAYVP